MAKKGRGVVGAGPWRRCGAAPHARTAPQRTQAPTHHSAAAQHPDSPPARRPPPCPCSRRRRRPPCRRSAEGEWEEVEKSVRTPGGAGRRPAGGCMPQRCVPGPPRRPRACSLFSGSLRNQRSCSNRAAIVQRTVYGGPRAAHSRLQHHRHSGSNFAASAQYRQAPGSNVRPQHQDPLQTGLTVLLPTQPILLLCVWWWEQE